MTQVAIVGGHGKIAQQLIPLLASAGHTPVAFVRNPAYADELEALGAQVRIVDLEKSGAEQLGMAMMGSEAVVFAAGAGADGDIDRKRTVDLDGAIKSMAGADLAGISRFVQVSAIGVDAPLPADVSAVWRAYVIAKRDADLELRATRLDWTIIRPGGLTDDPPTGLIDLADEVERGQITRADVAALIAACLDDPRTIGKQWEVVGGSTPIARAIDAAV
ncbi:MAG: NAD-dependent epimerase/dehydratase [Nocardioidaceae bacterium]|nr:NAD-dependent epimerase/dehydratase [Nocardioidaceae bacterium]